MKLLLFIMILCVGLVSNSYGEPGKRPSYTALQPPPAPPIMLNWKIDKDAMQEYVADVNTYAYYVYLYTRNLNQQAVKRGWNPPMLAPICERFEIPKLHSVPEKMFLDDKALTPQEISRDLSRKLNSLLWNYRSDRQALLDAYDQYLTTCLN